MYCYLHLKYWLWNSFRVLFCLVLLVNFSCKPQQKEKLSFQNGTRSGLDSIIGNIYNNFPLPGIAVVVVKSDTVYFKTIGYSNLSNKTPFTDSTIFFMGNLSEPMVAMAIGRMVHLKKLSLEDPVVKHLPYFKLGGEYKDILVSHLLTHTSGIPIHDAVWDMPSIADDALESTTRSIQMQEPKFVPPGSRVNRNAYNYDILADLVSKASHSSFEAAMKDFVFKPLKMSSSSFFKNDIPEEKLASPYIINDWLNYTMSGTELYPYNREHAGSIGFHTTVKDASTWIHTLLNPGEYTSFIDKDVAKQLLTPFKKTNLNNAYIGYGWEIEEVNKQLTLKKRHQLGDFSGEILLIPGTKTGILVVANIAGDFNPSTMIGQISSFLSSGKISPSKRPIFLPLGKLYYRTNNLDSVFLSYSQLKEKQPNDYDYTDASLGQLGVNLLYRLNRPSEAVRFFEFCTREHPNSAVTWLNLAEAHLLNKEFKQAEENLSKAKALSGNSEDILSRLEYIETTINMIKENETKK